MFIFVWTDSLRGSSSISGRSRDDLFLARSHSISRGRPRGSTGPREKEPPLFLTFPLKKELDPPLPPEAVRPSIKANPPESAGRRSQPKPGPGGAALLVPTPRIRPNLSKAASGEDSEE